MVKHNGGCFTLRGCFSPAGPGRLVTVVGKKKMQQYQEEILEGNLIETARHLRLGRRSVFQKDDDFKRRAKDLQD